MNILPRPSLLSTLCAALLAAGLGGAAHAADPPLAATVLFVAGDVAVTPAHAAGTAPGPARPVVRGAALYSGETIDTGSGRLQLKMVDGAMLSLQPATKLLLQDYHLAEGAGTEKGFLQLVKGGLRQISGSIGKTNRDDYRLETPMGLIGIRGTEFTAEVDEALKVTVVEGAVAVCNDGGCVDIGPGQSGVTPGGSVRPVLRTAAAVLVPSGDGVGVDAATRVAASAREAARAAGEVFGGSLAGAAPVDPRDAIAQASPVVAPAASPVVAVPAVVAAPGTTGVAAPATGSTVATGGTGTSSGSTSGSAGSGFSLTIGGAGVSLTIGVSNSGVGLSVSGSGGSGSASGSGSAVAPAAAWTASPTSGSGVFGAAWVTPARVSSALDSGARDVDAAGNVVQLTLDGAGGTLTATDGNAERGNDALVAWGRWTSGKSSVHSESGQLKSVSYFAFNGMPAQPAAAAYASFASTAPVVTGNNGNILVTGASNSVTGTLNVDFSGPSGGSASYSLKVPVQSQTFALTGTAAQTGPFGFAGGGNVANASQCQHGCGGALSNGNLVQGSIGGADGSRAGLAYGFTMDSGKVTGTVVFKTP